MFLAHDMKWDEKIKYPQEIIDGLADGRAAVNVFLVCVTEAGRIEILSCKEALKEINKPDKRTVIAASMGKTHAMETIAEMLNDWQNEHGSLAGFVDYYK